MEREQLDQERRDRESAMSALVASRRQNASEYDTKRLTQARERLTQSQDALKKLIRDREQKRSNRY